MTNNQIVSSGDDYLLIVFEYFKITKKSASCSSDFQSIYFKHIKYYLHQFAEHTALNSVYIQLCSCLCNLQSFVVVKVEVRNISPQLRAAQGYGRAVKLQETADDI